MLCCNFFFVRVFVNSRTTNKPNSHTYDTTHHRDQVEERLEFYKTGKAPRKNIDVMQEAVKASDAMQDNENGDAAPAGGEDKKKKKKKDKKRPAEEEAPAKESKKKKKKAKVEEEPVPVEKKAKKSKKKDKK